MQNGQNPHQQTHHNLYIPPWDGVSAHYATNRHKKLHTTHRRHKRCHTYEWWEYNLNTLVFIHWWSQSSDHVYTNYKKANKMPFTEDIGVAMENKKIPTHPYIANTTLANTICKQTNTTLHKTCKLFPEHKRQKIKLRGTTYKNTNNLRWVEHYL